MPTPALGTMIRPVGEIGAGEMEGKHCQVLLKTLNHREWRLLGNAVQLGPVWKSGTPTLMT